MSVSPTTPSRPLRALVVDDEPAARRLLLDLLAEIPDVEAAGICRNGREALARLAEEPVDILFLDVQMPGLDGFGVLDSLGPDTEERPRPAVILVTAHDEFAVRAFEAEAWDYLLKPFDGERLRQAIDRARKRMAQQHSAPDPASLDEAQAHEAPPAPPRRPLARLTVPHGRGRVTLRLDEVLWIQAESNYARFHLTEASYLTRMSLSQLEERVDPRRFVRVHRSAIVNVEKIERLDPRGRGDMLLTLRGGGQVPLSRRYRAGFEAVIESLP